jgi:uncharacterized protein with HEPN domain
LHSRIPWREMQTMRHKLVHDYFDVDLAVVWETVQRDLSPLTREVRQLLTILESGQLPRPP